MWVRIPSIDRKGSSFEVWLEGGDRLYPYGYSYPRFADALGRVATFNFKDRVADICKPSGGNSQRMARVVELRARSHHAGQMAQRQMVQTTRVVLRAPRTGTRGGNTRGIPSLQAAASPMLQAYLPRCTGGGAYIW